MTRKGSGANVSNGTNASNGEKRRGSRERGSEREKGLLGVLPAGSDLDASESERRNEDTPNEAFELEKPGMLPRSQVTAIQNLRRKSWSIDKIHATTGIAKSTVHKYCKNITPTGADDIEIEYRPNPEQITQLQTLRRQGMSNEELSKLFKWSLDVILEATRGVELDPAIASRQSQQAAEQPSSPPSTPAQPKLSYEVTTSNPPRIIEDGDESQD